MKVILQLVFAHHWQRPTCMMLDKNPSEDEIANVNFFTTILLAYFKIPKKRTYFV